MTDHWPITEQSCPRCGYRGGDPWRPFVAYHENGDVSHATSDDAWSPDAKYQGDPYVLRLGPFDPQRARAEAEALTEGARYADALRAAAERAERFRSDPTTRDEDR